MGPFAGDSKGNSQKVHRSSPRLFYRIRRAEFSFSVNNWFGNTPKTFCSKKAKKKRFLLHFLCRQSYTHKDIYCAPKWRPIPSRTSHKTRNWPVQKHIKNCPQTHPSFEKEHRKHSFFTCQNSFFVERSAQTPAAKFVAFFSSAQRCAAGCRKVEPSTSYKIIKTPLSQAYSIPIVSSPSSNGSCGTMCWAAACNTQDPRLNPAIGTLYLLLLILFYLILYFLCTSNDHDHLIFIIFHLYFTRSCIFLL